MALEREWRPADDPYRSIDPHGFGVMAAMIAALVCAGPVLWLMLQRGPDGAARDRTAERWQSAAVLLVVGTPMLLQIGYLRLPLAASWPVWASCAIWAALVLAACRSSAAGPSIHGAFARHPRVSWATVIATGAAKLGMPVYVLA